MLAYIEDEIENLRSCVSFKLFIIYYCIIIIIIIIIIIHLCSIRVIYCVMQQFLICDGYSSWRHQI
jgi:hypothetical protein